jgi:peptidylprolyl isomerase domain and WD repeat-containing protein 1
MVCTCGGERTVKMYDVMSFDMVGMLKLAFSPGCCAWIYGRGDAVQRLAVSDADSAAVHVFDARSAGGASAADAAQALATLTGLHSAPVTCMRFNAPACCVVSGDAKGMLEVWCASSLRAAAPPQVAFRFKADTDLYALAKARTVPGCIEVSADGEQFSVVSRDRRVRVFRFASCRLRAVLDESLEAAAETQRSGGPALTLDDIDYGRRMAVERELDREWGAGGAPSPNALFDESGNFLLYPTALGIKVFNLATGRLSRLLGRVENGERFLRLALFQGVPARDQLRGRSAVDAATVRATGGLAPDPTLACSAFHKHRLYLFSRREPSDAEEAGCGRDVFNEKPLADDLAAAAAAAGGAVSSLPASAVIHTTLGDIAVRLYGSECPRTVENWVTHSRNGYYDSLLFHRVIKGFMLQTGDPLGDGTGGQSIWGSEFEDELRRDLRHDRPYTLSMANAGPNTNGSQFFITTVATPWLDNKHTVFGRITKGADVVHAIENTKTDRQDRPITEIRIIGISLG